MKKEDTHVAGAYLREVRRMKREWEAEKALRSRPGDARWKNQPKHRRPVVHWAFPFSFHYPDGPEVRPCLLVEANLP